MKKVISYSLFQMPNVERWLFYVYFRGIVWNAKMNKAIYPDWITHIEVDAKTFSEFNNIFFGLKDIYGCEITVNPPASLCKGMLWRLKPVFDEDVEVVLFRDSDALTTYREATAIDRWINGSKEIVFTIKDNNAHTLNFMGGLTSVLAKPLREKYGNWNKFMNLMPQTFDNHGDDQSYLMKTIAEDFKHQLVVKDMRDISLYTAEPLEGVSEKLWLSNLCLRYIGEAGVNNMEYLRFEQAVLKNDAMEQIERSYPNVFYQYQL